MWLSATVAGGFCAFSVAVDRRSGLNGGRSGDQQFAHLGDHGPYPRAGRLYGRPNQAGDEFASGIGRETRKPIRRLVGLGLRVKK